jgi:hypothetical protein
LLKEEGSEKKVDYPLPPKGGSKTAIVLRISNDFIRLVNPSIAYPKIKEKVHFFKAPFRVPIAIGMGVKRENEKSLQI